MAQKIIWINVSALSFFILDRIIKNLFLVQASLSENFGPLNFYLYRNRQTIFGWSINTWWLNLLIFFIIIFLLYNLKEAYLKKESTPLLPLTLIIGGAISNILDKISYGFIVDYINLGPWNVFNLADLMIWAGAIILIVSYSKTNPFRTKLL